MNKVYQTKVSVFNSKGEHIVYGNCYATCIACLLYLPITEVPNLETLFDIPDDFHVEVLEKWLNERGYKAIGVKASEDVYHKEGIMSMNEIKEWEDRTDEYYIATGESPRGLNHACVYIAGVLYHDPHPSGEGLLNVETVIRIIPKDGKTQ